MTPVRVQPGINRVVSVRRLGALVAIIAGCGLDTTDARDTLRDAAQTSYPPTYRFTDVPDAAALQECAGAEQVVIGWVDTARSIASFGLDDESSPLTIWPPDGAFVRAAAVTEARTTEWIRVDATTPTSHRTALTNALGPSLAGYVFTASLPALPADLATATVQAARSVTSAIDSNGARVLTAIVSDETLSIAADDDRTDIELRFQLDTSDRIELIGVDSTTGEEPESFGFTLDYDWTPTRPTIVVPLTSEVTDAATLAPSRIRRVAQPTECSIGP